MVFGKKKVHEEPQPEKTQVLEAKIQSMDKTKLFEWLANEYKETYAGIFGPEDLKTLDPELLSLNILFAIWSEMRLLRELNSKQA
uniref:Uncharacterized protein n=1 Tax=viral metagenome TaxID=1070528 RepID=A0A6M3JWN6_9ZZZZ